MVVNKKPKLHIYNEAPSHTVEVFYPEVRSPQNWRYLMQAQSWHMRRGTWVDVLKFCGKLLYAVVVVPVLDRMVQELLNLPAKYVLQESDAKAGFDEK